MTEKLFEVTRVSFGIGKSIPPYLTVSADGRASSSGWANVRLEPYIYIDPPADGIQDFDLVGDAPDGGSTVMTDHCNISYGGSCDDWVVGVRVHAATNALEGSRGD
jgi:hypothetical protein